MGGKDKFFAKPSRKGETLAEITGITHFQHLKVSSASFRSISLTTKKHSSLSLRAEVNLVYSELDPLLHNSSLFELWVTN